MIGAPVSACGVIGAVSRFEGLSIGPQSRPCPHPTSVQRTQTAPSRHRSATVHAAKFKKNSNFIPAGEFQPRLLTHKLQQSQRVDDLQQLWDAHHEQFNPIHFSALMKQLAVLHAAASSGQQIQQPLNRQGAPESDEEALLRFLQEEGRDIGRKRHSSHASDLQQGKRTPLSQHAPQKPAVKQRKRQQSTAAAQQAVSQQARQQQKQCAADAAKQLARGVAAHALQLDECEQLDGRAVVMIAHSLAKVGAADSQLLQRLVQITGPQMLSQLDAQQLTNLIWALAVSTASAAGGGQHSYNTTISSSENNYAGPGPAPQATPSTANNAQRFQLPHSWLVSAANTLQQQFRHCSSQGIAMSLWGFAQVGFKPEGGWWSEFWRATESKLFKFSGQDLALTMYACGKLKAKIPDSWLSSYLSASCAVLPSLSPQQLTMSLWGLAAAGCQPDKAWLMLWFLESRTNLSAASTKDLCVWMYSLAVLRITPSPLWCTSYVEASFERLTAESTQPQELVNVMWAISCMSWSPPMLYWNGLLAAAAAKFGRFNAHDLSNCISAATAVDVNSIEKRWLTAFLQASEPMLSSFLPVHLAHTIKSLTIILHTHPWAYQCIKATWQAALVQAASTHLQQGAFSRRNLQQVVDGLRQLSYQPVSAETVAFLQRAEAVLEDPQSHPRQMMSATSGGMPAM